jgi:hypothetical protein
VFVWIFRENPTESNGRICNDADKNRAAGPPFPSFDSIVYTHDSTRSFSPVYSIFATIPSLL